MANYSKTDWVEGITGITANRLNNIETGIRESRWYGTTANSGNTYTVTLEPVPAEYYSGMRVMTKINAANTGAITLNCNGLGAKSCKMPNGDDIPSGKLAANSVVTWVYNGVNFILQGSDSVGDATAADVVAGKTFSNDTLTGETGTLALSGDAAAADVLIGKKYYKNDPHSQQTGTMPNRAGDTPALSSSTSGTTLKLLTSNGYRDGVNDYVTITDANFLDENILYGKSLFNKIGTFSNIKSIQRGTVQINNGGASPYTLSTTISSVDLDCSIVKIYVKSPSDDSYDRCDRCSVKVYIDASTTLKFYLDEATVSSGGYTPYIAWEVIEFNNVKSLQKGTCSYTSSGSYTDVTVSNFTTSKAILFFSFSSTSTSDELTDYMTAGYITDGTTVTFYGNSGAGTKSIYYYLIEFN